MYATKLSKLSTQLQALSHMTGKYIPNEQPLGYTRPNLLREIGDTTTLAPRGGTRGIRVSPVPR